MPTLFRAVRKITPTFIVFILVSCSGNETDIDNTTAIKSMEESISNSNKLINTSSEEILHELENKLQDPDTKDIALLWYPRAQIIRRESTDLYDSLEKMKRLKKLDADRAAMLYDDLISFRAKIFAIDSSLRYFYTNNIEIFSHSFDSTGTKGKDSYITLFQKITPLSALLGKIQNNIKIMENKLITYCNYKSSLIIEDFHVYSAIVGQSSTILRAGEELTIKAGMGAFSKTMLPKVKIGHVFVPITDSGFARFTITANNKPGKYTLPVEITYMDQISGKEQKINYDLKYIVAKECDQ